MCKKIFKYHLVMSKTIALIRHPSLLFSLYPEVKNHRSYSAPSLLFFCSQNVLHRSYSARFSISFIWHSGVFPSDAVDKFPGPSPDLKPKNPNPLVHGQKKVVP